MKAPVSQYSKERIAAARHFLFVPGNRPERFGKAKDSGADAIIIDLEDAVPPDQKGPAREAARHWLESVGQAMVRINAADSDHFSRDMELAAHPNVLGIMLPKAMSGPALTSLAAIVPTLALVESARGVADLDAIARTPGVVRLALGTIDLALDLDMLADDSAFDAVRLQMTIASRAANIAPPVDGVTAAFADDHASETAMRSARSLGFRAKLCIHPRQLLPIEAALSPSDAEVVMARKIVEADRASGGAAVALEGAMIDRPIVERAYRLLDHLPK